MSGSPTLASSANIRRTKAPHWSRVLNGRTAEVPLFPHAIVALPRTVNWFQLLTFFQMLGM